MEHHLPIVAFCCFGSSRYRQNALTCDEDIDLLDAALQLVAQLQRVLDERQITSVGLD